MSVSMEPLSSVKIKRRTSISYTGSLCKCSYNCCV